MFILKENDELEPLEPMKFELEADFQKLLERYPALLSGELINPENPRKWVLVSREMPIPAEADGNGVWSLDHLFLDQDGVPTFVEVKRKSDTRLRREVVGQMLDYAANASAYWRVDTLRALFEEDCRSRNINPDDELQSRLGPDLDPAIFWLTIKTNLEAGKLRLLFVADWIPKELKIVVEFLNRQMNPTEVLALELTQHGGHSGIRTLVPTLYGQTERARAQKSILVGRQWDKDSFFSLLSDQVNTHAVESAKDLLSWTGSQPGWRAVYGRGRENGTISISINSHGTKLTPIQIYTNGKLYFTLTECKKPPFDQDDKRTQFLDRLNEAGSFNFPMDSINKQPWVSLESLAEGDKTEKLKSVLMWFAAEINTSQAGLS